MILIDANARRPTAVSCKSVSLYHRLLGLLNQSDESNITMQPGDLR